VGQGKRADAVKTLLRGSGHLRRRRGLRPRAIELLESALKLVPFHLVATLDLASLLTKQGRGPAAIDLLNGLLPRVSGPAVRRVRWALLRSSTSPASFWRWFRTFFGAPR
jgi:predicted Zn-dependent protease